MVGMTCLGIAIGIYAYTIFAMKQETFLDDFEMPDPLLDEERKEWTLFCHTMFLFVSIIPTSKNLVQ